MNLKSYLFENNIKKLTNDIVLFYGENLGLKNDFKKNIKTSLIDAELINLDQEDIIKNEKKFTEEFLNISLFNEQKIYFINQVNDKLIEFVEYVENKIENQKIFLFAENLEKKSKIRTYFERSKTLGIIACYQDNEIGLKKIDSVGYFLNDGCTETLKLGQRGHRNQNSTTVITFSQNEFHKIWENTLENFGFHIGGIPLKNNFEEGLSNFEHHIWTGCGSFVYGVPFAVDENGILKQLREVNADYIITIPNYNGYRFSGTIYRAKDLIKVAEFYSDLNFSVEDNDKTFLKRRRLLNKLWNKSKKVEGINLTRDDFISVIFDELIKSSEKIYEDISKFKLMIIYVCP